MRRIQRLGIVLAALAAAASAERVEERRATFTGSRGDRGKCTIEVNVDDVAEVEISGDRGRLRTLSGQPSVWRRFECSDPLPRDFADFRYSGVDGRGRQFLLKDPRNNRGVAVIRIEDPKGGREGYTFDIEWSKGSDDRNRDGDRDRDRDRNRDRDKDH